MFYNIKDILREVKALKIPSDYWHIPVEDVLTNDFTILLSIREDAGKTTQSLLFGLVLYKLYGTTTEYLRNDKTQVTRGKIETLYKTVREHGYIQRCFNDKFNDVEYSPIVKKFFLIKRDADGVIIDRDTEPLCVIHATEEAESFKSSYNNPKGDYIVLDEFMDSHRASYNLWIDLMTCISTIGRPGSRGREDRVFCIMLGNNTNEYSQWFDDFCISDKIPDLKYGGVIRWETALGTTGTCRLLEVSERQKEKIKQKRVRFFGFPTKKAAQFIGTAEWSGKSYPHPKERMDYDNKIYSRLYVLHRDRYIQLELFKYDTGYQVLAHFSRPPLLEDNIILTLFPEKKCEVYGYGQFQDNKRIKKVIDVYFKLKNENRWLFASNMVGELVEDFQKNINKV